MKNIKIWARTISILIIISLAFIGSDCNEIIQTISNPNCTGSQVDIIGTWRFVFNAGGIRDVCLGEIVEFTTGGIANLTCPGQPTIQRNYTVSNDYILTYTQTNVKYCLDGDSTEILLTGLNNNRILVYDKVITSDNVEKSNPVEQSIYFNNSSEITKSIYYNEK